MLAMAEDQWFQYLQPSARRRRAGGFRAVQLNVVGWAALLAPGGLAGLLIALRFHLPPVPGAVVGGLVAWATGLVLDSGKWARLETEIAANHELSQLQALTSRLQAEGVTVRIEPSHPGDWARYRLIAERRWVERVRASLEDLDGPQI
jgi:hypothetical protein